MNAFLLKPIAKKVLVLLSVALSLNAVGETVNNCVDISNDVKIAVEKDTSKVLMVVEDALVINEGCAADIVKAAIMASKADAKLANQIVQTAVTVAPKMAGVINDAATSVIPGLAVTAPVADVTRPVTVADGKNPGKNPVLNSPEPEAKKTLDSPEPSISMGPVRGVFLTPPVSGPLPPRTSTNPVSPSNSIP